MCSLSRRKQKLVPIDLPSRLIPKEKLIHLNDQSNLVAIVNQPRTDSLMQNRVFYSHRNQKAELECVLAFQMIEKSQLGTD